MLSKQEMRRIALGAARSQMRLMGIEPEQATAEQALAVLDDAYRMDERLIASIWYSTASDAQVAAFRKEWGKAR